MAVYVSNTAGRLGRYYSKGMSFSDVMPETAEEAFETVTGVWDVKQERRISRLMKKEGFKKALLAMDDEDIDVLIEEVTSETTATLLAKGEALDMVDLTWPLRDSKEKKN